MQNENYSNTNRKSKLGLGLIVISVIVIIGGIFLGFKLSNSNVLRTANGASQTPMQIKFSDTSASNNAVQIFPGALTSEAKTALSGFTVTTETVADGSSIVTLTSNNPEYKTQKYIVTPGAFLYFIENNSSDDSGDAVSSADRYLGDDTAVVVDANGYITK